MQWLNKNPRCVASYFIKHVKAAHGCPVRVYTDPGTENGLVAGIQCYLRGEGLDEYAGSKSHKYVSSPKNQRIECQWSHYRKQRLSWWIDFFNDLHKSDILDLTSDLRKKAIWFCFAELLQTDLDKVKEYWNSHRIRKFEACHCIRCSCQRILDTPTAWFQYCHTSSQKWKIGLKGSMLRMMSAT